MEYVRWAAYWYPIVGSATAASATISDGDVLISQAWQHDPFPGLENTFNAVTTTYTSPASLWEVSTLETIVKDEWVAEDGRQKLFELNLPMVYSAEQARQLTDALLRENRRFRTHRLPLPGEYARLRPLQNVHLSLQDYGYDAKTFRITEAAYDLQTLIRCSCSCSAARRCLREVHLELALADRGRGRGRLAGLSHPQADRRQGQDCTAGS
ncbi:phage tail protein [Tritonibacter mobilis]|uniref:phage tail protein n=1 Tax=Tritonibacter mobilis TaxID=379347 RepID=UPI00398FE268